MSGDHSRNIVVSKYTLTLIWPVVLRGLPQGDQSEKNPLLEQWANWFCDSKRGWADVLASVNSDAISPVPSCFDYAEIVYFHPFVRDFLMGDGGTPKKDLSTRILERRDIKKVKVEVLKQTVKVDGTDQEQIITQEFEVGRVQLYLMKPCVALVTIELNASGRTLHELQQFQDRFRRIYPPFWVGTDPGLCVRAVTWLGENDTVLCHSNVHEQQQACLDFAQAGGEPPVLKHWQYFFGDLHPLRTREQLENRKEKKKAELCYQQLTDERIPTMSYFAVPNPRAISEGDYDRLTFVDDAADQVDGNWVPNTYPYNPTFLEQSRATYRYERFSHYGTTYLACGYGFTAIGKDDWFFTNIIHGHFSRHYYRMGLLAHYQRAALLFFGDELSNAIKDLAGEGPHQELQNKEFRQHVEEIQMGFLKFRSRAFFPEVSNQLQAQELWKFWFDHLNTKVLFDSVDCTSHRLTDVLAENEARDLSRSQERLSKLAGIILPISLSLSLLSVLFAGDFLPKFINPNPSNPDDVTRVVASLSIWFVGISAIGVLVSGWLFMRWSRKPKS